VIVLLAAACGVALRIALSVDGTLPALSDARIYRAGAAVWWHGGELYNSYLHGGGNPALFTYPPFAVLPIAAVFGIFKVGALVLVLGSVAALFHIFLLVLDRFRRDLPHRHLIAAAATLCATELEPVTQTLFWGQVNVFLVWLVAVDCLTRSPRWPRGVLIGIAAAIKLTPIAFVLYFLTGKQGRAVVTAVASFLACGAIGFVIAPSDSVDFWTRAVVDPARVGNVALPGNQSLRGVLSRLDLSASAISTAWIVLAGAVVLLTAYVAFRYRREGHDLTAWLAVAAMGTLVSPMSWSHHWVWLTALLVAGTMWSVGGDKPYRRILVVGLVGAAALFAPHWRFPATATSPWWWHVVGESYVWIGVGLVVALAVQAGRLRKPKGEETRHVELDADEWLTSEAEVAQRV
jgi:alpha-1,2-mannosyltransferase